MRVVTLGTGSPIPDPNRAGPSTLVTGFLRDLAIACPITRANGAATVAAPASSRMAITKVLIR